MEKLIDIKEAARLLAVSTRTIRRYVEAGKLRQVKLSNRCVRFEASEIRRLLKGLIDG